MNDEIKEILNIIECWRNGDYVLAYSFNYDRASKQNNKLLDYITNLSQQIEKLQQELQRKYNIINEIKKELTKDYNTYVCKNKSYGKTFKAGAETYKEHLLYKIKELEMM